MGFSAKQVRSLRQNLHARNVRTRSASGRELSYIEGWHAIAEANRIFGFDGWDRETVESRCVMTRELRGTFYAVYTAKVRISVRAGSDTIVREGHGTGEARGTTAGEVHDTACKAAETDATKRALATFGKPFGMALYLGGRRSVGGSQQIQQAQISTRRPSGSSGDPFVTCGTIRPAQKTDGRGSDCLIADQQLDSLGDITQTRASGEASAACPGPLQEKRGATKADVAHPEDLIAEHRDKLRIQLGSPRRYRDREHLRFVASQPCLFCGRMPSDPHHLRFAQPRALGVKVSDEFTVPLCRGHHRQLHQSGNEWAWWNDMDVDPLPIALGLWEQSRSKRNPADTSQVGQNAELLNTQGGPASTA